MRYANYQLITIIEFKDDNINSYNIIFSRRHFYFSQLDIIYQDMGMVSELFLNRLFKTIKKKTWYVKKKKNSRAHAIIIQCHTRRRRHRSFCPLQVPPRPTKRSIPNKNKLKQVYIIGIHFPAITILYGKSTDCNFTPDQRSRDIIYECNNIIMVPNIAKLMLSKQNISDNRTNTRARMPISYIMCVSHTRMTNCVYE